MKFDTFLNTVGDWGKFQKVKYTIICLAYMLPSIMVYTYVFTGAKPMIRCQNPPTSAQCNNYTQHISISECQSCYVRSQTGIHEKTGPPRPPIETCSEYVYDKTYYKNTLVTEWNMVCDRTYYRSTLQMIFFGGYMVGSVVFGILADRYGRRPIMSVSFIIMTFSGFLCAFGPQDSFGFWPSYILFALGRFLLACATRGVSVSGFVLGSEIVSPRKRLLTGVVIEYFFAFGELFLLAFAYFIRTWRALTWSISLFTVPFMLFYFILPESPRWLVSKGRFGEAEKVLRYIAKKNKREFNEDAFQEMKKEQEKNMNSKQYQEGVRSLFQSKIMCMISINLFFQWLAQNLMFYGISQNTGAWGLNPYVSFGLSAIFEITGYAAVQLMLDRVGRKKPYIIFSISFGLITMLILPAKRFLPKNSTAETVISFLINGVQKFCVSGSYAIIYIYANELFPTNVRNTGMGICSMVARIGAIIGSYCNDNLARVWTHLPAIFYGIVAIIAAILALVFPETLNKQLPQCVADVERMGIVGFGNKTLRSTVVDIPTITVSGEEIVNKLDSKKSDQVDEKI